MTTPRLGLYVSALSAGLVVLTVGVVSWSASVVLGEVAEEWALASARVAAADVADTLRREEERVLTAAEVLAQRPTLRRLVVTDDRAGLAAFLEIFRRTSHLESCGAAMGGELLAVAGTPPPKEPNEGASGRGPVDISVEDGTQRARLESHVAVEGLSGVAVFASVSTTASPKASTVVSLRLWSRERLEDGSFGPRSPLREAALRDGESVGREIGEDRAFVAVVPIRSGGSIVGIVEAEVSLRHAVAARRSWIREVRRVVFLMVGLGLAGSLAFGRWLAGPIEEMTRAAGRIGLGDLETSVPAGGAGELGILARSLNEMRLRLLEQARQIEQRRAESEAVLSGIADGVFAVDGERRIRLISVRAARLLSVTEDEAIGRFCGDVLRPIGPDGERPCEEHCPILEARTGGRGRAVEHVEPAAGARRTVVVTSAPPVEGRQIQLLREESESETTRRLRDTVVANISHEFRTPLAAQLASIELLRDRIGELPPNEALSLVRSVERGALRLTRLIDNLLESVRLDAGERAIRMAPIAIDEIVEEAVESMRPLLEQRGQRVDTDLAHPSPTVLGDAPRLVQVLVNLLANANKFAPPGSTIRVGGDVDAGRVTMWVQDEGPGLPEGDDETVFGRFVRRAGEEPEQSGMGLGLWIARSIVERHHGRIWSAAAEKGAKLCIVLPEAPREDPRRG